MEKTNCWNCKYLIKSIHMKLEDEILYSCWCEVGDMEDEKCEKYENITT